MSVAIDMEYLQDQLSSFIVAGSNISVTYSDAGNTLTIAYTGTQLTQENVEDYVAALLAAGTHTGISFTYNDGTPSIDATVAAEFIQDTAAAMLTGGTHSGISFSYNDTTGLIDATVSGGGLTQEQIEDFLASTFLAAGVGIGLAYNDGANTLTISVTDPNDGMIYGFQSNNWRDIGLKVNTGASSSYTPALTDTNDTITLTYTGAVTVALPQNSDVAFLVGTWMKFIHGVNCTGITLSAGTGATVRGTCLSTFRPGDEIWAIKTDTNTWYVFTADTGGLYAIGGFFNTAPATTEVIMRHLFTQAVVFPGNFSGSRGYVGTNPAATFAIDVTKNGTTCGTISISTSGVFTFTSTSGAAVSFAAGDRMEWIGPTADASIANFAATLAGRK